MTIKGDDYNTAIDILIAAGSNTKTHKKHGKDLSSGVPDRHGISLLNECLSEFQRTGITAIQKRALAKAAKAMGIDNPDTPNIVSA